jgi:hypothetical protein
MDIRARGVVEQFQIQQALDRVIGDVLARGNKGLQRGSFGISRAGVAVVFRAEHVQYLWR